MIEKTGVGKSSWISGTSGRQLYVSRNTNRATVHPEIVDIGGWTILDTPGLFDPQEKQRGIHSTRDYNRYFPTDKVERLFSSKSATR